MRKLLITLTICLSLATLGYSSGVFLRLSGGGTYVLGGNYDQALKGRSDYYHSLTGLQYSGELGKARVSTDFGAEIEYDPVDYAGISIGLGYHNLGSDSRLEMTGSDNIADEYASLIRAFSFGASLHLYFPLSETLRVHVSAGPEIHFPSFNLDRTFGQESILTSFGLTFDSERKAVAGLKAALGIDASFTDTVSGFLQAVYRPAVFTLPQGHYTLAGSAGDSIIAELGDAFFWYDEIETGGTYFADLTLAQTQPSGSNRRNVAPLKVGFGGIGLEIGLKIGF